MLTTDVPWRVLALMSPSLSIVVLGYTQPSPLYGEQLHPSARHDCRMSHERRGATSMADTGTDTFLGNVGGVVKPITRVTNET